MPFGELGVFVQMCTGMPNILSELVKIISIRRFRFMKKKMTTVTFKGTAEQEKKLRAVIEQYKDMEGNLLPVLQGAQEIYGYLPIEVQKIIAEGLDVSMTEIYGVASFYAQFKLNPDGEVAISVCLGTACYVKGAGELADKVTELVGVAAGETSADGKYSFEATRCIGACGLAPVMTVNGDVYGRITGKDVQGILAKYQ
jgi:NADH:ubiquinone oxidoreductase subunit E